VIILAQVISTLSQILYWLVIISVILSYFMDPFHPLRRGIDNIVEPMLNPIRRVVPPMGGFDFSPIVLIVLIQIISNLIIRMIT
jgi:YggT family protein